MFHMYVKFKFLVAIFVFLLLIAGLVMWKSGLSPFKSNEIGPFMKAYTKWFINAGKNIGNLVGYAVKQDWSPSINNTQTNSLNNITKN